jgi:hypothetical protein
LVSRRNRRFVSPEFVDVPGEAARQGMLEQGMPENLADFVVKLFEALRDGLAGQTTDTVRTLSGREPRTFAEFAKEHATCSERASR